MIRAPWEHLPEHVREAVQLEVGQVVKAETAEAGMMPGLAARLHLGDGSSVFIKAIAEDHRAAFLHRRQEWAGQSLPAAVPVPRMLWSSHSGGWIVLVHEFLDGARGVDLTPGSHDLPAVLDVMRELGEVLRPAPAGAVLVGDNLALLKRKAALMLGKHRHLLGPDDLALFETALAGFDEAALDGDTLIHYDLHGENILRLPCGDIRVIDWSFAARAAAWVDGALLAPRLIESGHNPSEADSVLAELPAWTSAPRPAVRGLGVLWTLFRVYKSVFGPAEGRDFRARAANAGRVWVQHSLAT